MPVDRRLILGGIAAILALVLAYMLLAGTDEATPPARPPPPPAVPVAAATPPPPAAPASSPEGLRLHGLTGAGAIIGMPDGSQRLVRIGREVLPGLVLQQVRIDHALLQSSAGTFQLGFGGIAASPPPAAANTPSNLPQLAAPEGAPARRNPLGGFIMNDAQHEQATRQYMAGLRPRRADGRIAGFTLQRGVRMPVLEQAGLRPGDVLLSVNGEPVADAEYIQNLSRTIVGTYTTRFEVERNGQVINLAIQVNPRS